MNVTLSITVDISIYSIRLQDIMLSFSKFRKHTADIMQSRVLISARLLLQLTTTLLRHRRGLASDTNLRGFSNFIGNLTNYAYDKRLRPSDFGTSAEVQLAIMAIGPITLLTKSVRAELILRHWWTDNRLRYDNQSTLNFNGNAAELIWTPDTYVSNAIDSKVQRGVTENVRTQISPGGKVFTSSRFTVEFSCPMNFKRFPMDTQMCPLILESYAYPLNELNLSWVSHLPPIEVAYETLDLSDYTILKVKPVYSSSVYLPSQSFAVLKAMLYFKRLLPYYIYHVYIPSSCLVVLSWSTFWIPFKAIPGRVTLIVTNFLTSILVFNEVGTSKAKAPYPTAIELYALANTTFIFFAMVEYILVLAHIQNIQCGKLSRRSLNASSWKEQEEGKVHPRLQVHRFDRISRFIFPSAYAVVMAFYFAYYLVE